MSQRANFVHQVALFLWRFAAFICRHRFHTHAIGAKYGFRSLDLDGIVGTYANGTQLEKFPQHLEGDDEAPGFNAAADVRQDGAMVQIWVTQVAFRVFRRLDADAVAPAFMPLDEQANAERSTRAVSSAIPKARVELLTAVAPRGTEQFARDTFTVTPDYHLIASAEN